MSYEGNIILVLDVVFHIMLVFIYCKTVFLIFQKSAHGDPAVDFCLSIEISINFAPNLSIQISAPIPELNWN